MQSLFVIGGRRSETSTVTGLLAYSERLFRGGEEHRPNGTSRFGAFESREVNALNEALFAEVVPDWQLQSQWYSWLAEQTI
ncbi:MAG: hypothetical protein ACI8QS_001631 [Planctomycetota bacterium]|jgi:hypothetical protein